MKKAGGGKDYMNKQFESGVSLIMCCYNSEKLIKKPLEAILEQQVNVPYEMIIVDNNCTDNTVALIKKIYKESGSSAHLTIVEEPEPGVGHARKKGFLAAKYPYISFIDDDNIINNNWVNTVHDLFQKKPEMGIIGSNNKALFLDGIEPDWFDAVKGQYACASQGNDLEDLTYTRRFVYGAGMSIKKEILVEVYAIPLPLYLLGRKGDKLFSGDDSELGMRAILLGHKMYCSDRLKLKHIMPKERMTWSYFRKMSEGHGKSHIILQVYSKLIQGTKPLGKRQILRELIDAWKEYIKTYKFRNINQPNHISSKKYTQLKGRTLGIIHYFNSYNEIVQSVTGVFKSLNLKDGSL